MKNYLFVLIPSFKLTKKLSKGVLKKMFTLTVDKFLLKAFA